MHELCGLWEYQGITINLSTYAGAEAYSVTEGTGYMAFEVIPQRGGGVPEYPFVRVPGYETGILTPQLPRRKFPLRATEVIFDTPTAGKMAVVCLLHQRDAVRRKLWYGKARSGGY